MSHLDFTSMRFALPDTAETQPEQHNAPRRTSPVPATHAQVDDTQSDMDVDVLDPQEWTPDEASINYLRNLTCKPAGHPHARRVPVTNTWIQAKFPEISNHKRDRLLAGFAAEDAFPDYDINNDKDACLQVSKFGKGSSLAIQACIREHIRFLCSTNGSKEAFPTGRVTNARRQQFLDHQFDAENPDLGSTAEACCPDLDGSACSAWNLTFIDSVARDFVAKVRMGMYLDHDLPAEAKVERLVKKRVKTCLRSMIKKERRRRRLDTAEKLNAAKAVDKYTQRRRVKHQARLRTCDKSVKYRKYFALLKAVGPEGNSDEETDTEAGVTPLPIRIFPMKWRSKAYERLLHNLDREAENKETHPLLRGGPLRTPSRSARTARPRIRSTTLARKSLPISCPQGKPLEFYDSAFLREAKRAGLLPHLRVGTPYTHKLPRE